MLTPDDFAVNEAWIALKLNGDPLRVQDEAWNLYALIDAASTYVFGQVMSPVAGGRPTTAEVEDMFAKAWQSKEQWPRRLILTEDSPAARIIRACAEKNGLSVEVVSPAELRPIIGPLRQSFAQHFSAGAG